MSNIGILSTTKTIENAMKEIREWLNKINVGGLDINLKYDPRINVAVAEFKYKGKKYEFRSTQQKNCRLNMHGIARVMEYKVRSHLMGIENFESSMVSYLAIEDKSNTENIEVENNISEIDYIKLGISPLASNEEIVKRYRDLVKTFHPDMALSEEAKKEFEKRLSEINEAYNNIKIGRGL